MLVFLLTYVARSLGVCLLAFVLYASYLLAGTLTGWLSGILVLCFLAVFAARIFSIRCFLSGALNCCFLAVLPVDL